MFIHHRVERGTARAHNTRAASWRLQCLIGTLKGRKPSSKHVRIAACEHRPMLGTLELPFPVQCSVNVRFGPTSPGIRPMVVQDAFLPCTVSIWTKQAGEERSTCLGMGVDGSCKGRGRTTSRRSHFQFHFKCSGQAHWGKDQLTGRKRPWQPGGSQSRGVSMPIDHSQDLPRGPSRRASELSMDQQTTTET